MSVMKRNATLLVGLLALLPSLVLGQAGPSPYRPPPGVAAGPSLVPATPPLPPRQDPKFDMTGQWVPIISEDYQWRMITPPKGEFSSLPLSAAAVAVANAWDLDADNAAGNQCKAFGAPGLMRLPARFRVSWENDTTLKVESDAGQQVRLLRFGESTPGELSRQGHSVASWQKVVQGRDVFTAGQGLGRAAPGPGGSLKVVTTHLLPGYLRKNGVPYGSRTVLTEYFNRIEEPNGDSWLIVTTIIEDPEYLTLPFITSTHFLKEPEGGRWSPAPCRTDPPFRATAPLLQE